MSRLRENLFFSRQNKAKKGLLHSPWQRWSYMSNVTHHHLCLKASESSKMHWKCGNFQSLQRASSLKLAAVLHQSMTFSTPLIDCLTDKFGSQSTYLASDPRDADLTSNGVINSVSKKWPRWFVPNCISNPSSVFHSGHIMMPVMVRKKSNILPLILGMHGELQCGKISSASVTSKNYKEKSTLVSLLKHKKCKKWRY